VVLTLIEFLAKPSIIANNKPITYNKQGRNIAGSHFFFFAGRASGSFFLMTILLASLCGNELCCLPSKLFF